MVENCVANYTSEVSPVYVRGFFTGSLLMFNTLGNLWGTGMSNAYKLVTTSRGWMVRCCQDGADFRCLLACSWSLLQS